MEVESFVLTKMASILTLLTVRNIINAPMERHMSIPVPQDIYGMIS